MQKTLKFEVVADWAGYQSMREKTLAAAAGGASNGRAGNDTAGPNNELAAAPPTNANSGWTVTLAKEAHASFGVQIIADDRTLRPVFVSEVLPNTPAQLSGRIWRGNRIMAVNGTPTETAIRSKFEKGACFFLAADLAIDFSSNRHGAELDQVESHCRDFGPLQ